MPISAENLALYPPDWPQIRERIILRDGNRCKFCGVDNGALGFRWDDGRFVSYEGLTAAEWWDVERSRGDRKIIRIVLTVAHLADPNPANCADENLAALCQRCHNRHDQPMRMAHAAATRKARKAAGDLFE